MKEKVHKFKYKAEIDKEINTYLSCFKYLWEKEIKKLLNINCREV